MLKSKQELSAKMLVCTYVVKDLLSKIHDLEKDTQTSVDEKFSQIKKIREEISKVGTEIDNIKKEITLLNAYSIN